VEPIAVLSQTANSMTRIEKKRKRTRRVKYLKNSESIPIERDVCLPKSSGSNTSWQREGTGVERHAGRID